ncbi:gem-associated protein 8 [Thalassophryne amazonica]|uniref:gem-associated protein 8 n=1 Tax=Thalassophryne amazonica TaxID=390379 RepID=UPI00147227B6|nr:gem-associated protein 8 [Thalassophryne amazonica]
MQEELNTVRSWFTSPVYSRYWQHYEQSMAWYQRHRRAYKKALQAAYGPGYHPQQYPRSCHRYANCHSGASKSKKGQNDSEIDCNISNIEISVELRQYFAQTERHKEERKKQQQIEAEQHDKYVPADQDLHCVLSRSSVAPPSERPGERRVAEMKKLYGKDAAKIQAMETAMQMTFDRNCDLKQPKYWPVIPLKL